MKSKLLFTCLACLLLGVAACDLPIYPVAPAATLASMPTVPSQDPAVATGVAGTQIAAAINATVAAMNTPVSPAAPATDTPQPTATFTFTPTPTSTFTATFTPIPSLTPTATPSPTVTLPLPPQPTNTSTVPILSVSIATNCRSGPGQAYNILGGIQPGQLAEIVGQSTTSNYWVVRLPSNPAIICWAWGQYATIGGSVTGLPVFTPPPTPTAVITFTVSYNGMATCGGLYAFRFMITNNGSLTWESIRINITDNTTAATFTHQLDAFRDYTSCILGDMNQDLMPGESGGAANVSPGHLAYDPTGHSITATITVCSQNGMAGTCLSKTLNFTP